MKKLTNSLLLIYCFFTFILCIEVKFKESQPVSTIPLLVFPEELNGNYINQDGDTLIIKGRNFSLVNRKSKCDRLFEHDSLSDNNLLKRWKQYYFLNINEDSLWTVVLIQRHNGGDLTASLIDAESEENLDNLSRLIQIDTLFSDDGDIIHYVIEPGKDVLKEIIDNGIFSDQYIFQKITNQ